MQSVWLLSRLPPAALAATMGSNLRFEQRLGWGLFLLDSPVIIMLVLLIIFSGTFIHSTVGFGSALVEMPLLTLLVGVTQATPLVGLLGLVMVMIIAGGSWRSINFGDVWRLVVASLVGIPCGLFLLKTAPEGLVKAILGLLIIGFSLYNLTCPRLPTLRTERWAFGFGFLAGLLSGAYNTGGPPVVLYGALRRWSPTSFRATMQGYFLPGSWLVVFGHGLARLWSWEVVLLFGLSLLPMMAAVYLGGRLNRHIPTGRFDRLLYVLLIVLGILLLI